MPTAVRLLGLFNATPFFVRRHLVEETRGFARDIARKVDPGVASDDIRDVAAAEVSTQEDLSIDDVGKRAFGPITDA